MAQLAIRLNPVDPAQLDGHPGRSASSSAPQTPSNVKLSTVRFRIEYPADERQRHMRSGSSGRKHSLLAPSSIGRATQPTAVRAARGRL